MGCYILDTLNKYSKQLLKQVIFNKDSNFISYQSYIRGPKMLHDLEVHKIIKVLVTY
jgi:hypothetical protein